MKCFLDRSVLVESCLSNCLKYAVAEELVNGSHSYTAILGIKKAPGILSSSVARIKP
jgi:hypothetical protein